MIPGPDEDSLVPLKRWGDLRVGDFVVVDCADDVPADILILSTSEPDGQCLVETVMLDGESNLKMKYAVSDTKSLDPYTIKGRLWVEQPNGRLGSFQGTMRLQGLPRSTPLNYGNIVLKGSKVRNASITGVVIYTGRDTKLALNSSRLEKRTKRSKLEQKTNLVLIFLLLAIVVLAATATTMSWTGRRLNQSATELYVGDVEETLNERSWFHKFISFLALFNNFVPISLYVTLDLVRFIQANLVGKDRHLMVDQNLTRNLNSAPHFGYDSKDAH